MPLSYGGGVTNIDQIRKLLAIGYEKVVLNTALIDNPDLIRQAAELFGSQSVVASIDAKKTSTGYEAFVEDGTRKTGITPAELARKALELGAGEIIINSMDNDGMMQGYDIDLVKEIADAVDIPVTAIGGAHYRTEGRGTD
nr:HisA/HisF-related TIM barrel protein [uncultured Butyrivibrio sp.]